MRRSILLSVVSIWASLAPRGATAAADAVPSARGLSVSGLKTEYLVNPLCLDRNKPRFSWELESRQRGVKQRSYRILVATDPASLKHNRCDVWDSGVVVSDQSVNVGYAGPRLEFGRVYHWQVWCEDNSGRRATSMLGTFETGPQTSEDWQASWISRDRAIDAEFLGKWIWPESGKRGFQEAWFRKTFSCDEPGAVEQADVLLSAHFGYELFVNGEKLFADNNVRACDRIDFTHLLRPGINVIAIHAFNIHPLRQRFGHLTAHGGLICDARVRLAEREEILASDASWRCSLEKQDGWTNVAFNDSSWKAAKEVCAYREAPFPEVLKSKPERAISFRKSFQLDAVPQRARAYVSALGVYEMRINGKRVGNEVLSPGWTHYPKRVNYQAYDVTELLQVGENAVTAVCGAGWYSCGIFGAGLNYFYSHENPALLCRLEMVDQEGRSIAVTTNESWKTAESAIVKNNLYHGEEYDARLEPDGWTEAGFDDSGWSPAVLREHSGTVTAQVCEPIRVVERLRPVSIWSVGDDAWVADFGQNFAGFIELTCNEQRGTRIEVSFSENLHPDGTLNKANLRTARAVDVYTCKGSGVETWRPRFTFHGFRYVEVRGLSTTPTRNTVTGCVIQSDMSQTGQFHSSSEQLNRLWKAILWTQKSNYISVPTDCPQRDERAGWTGDAVFFMPTAMWNMQMPAFYEKRMKDLTDSQHEEGASVNQAPVIMAAKNGAGWGDELMLLPWYVYQFYGDREILANNYDALKRYADWLIGRAGDLESGIGKLPRSFGDHLSLEGKRQEFTAAAWFCHVIDLFARIAAVCEKTEDSQTYRAKANRYRDLFNLIYFEDFPTQSHERYSYQGINASQTSNVLPLAFDLVPDRYRSWVVRNLVQNIRFHGYHPVTGIMGTQFLLNVLSENGAHEVACRLISQRTFPSWGYMLDSGATTIWERWDSDWSVEPMNSRNHPALGAVGQWLFNTLAGIRPSKTGAGFQRFIIAPHLHTDLDFVRCRYRSLYGEIGVSWHRSAGGLSLQLEIPPNTAATVIVPNGFRQDILLDGKPAKGPTMELPSGRYRISSHAGSQ